VLDRIPGETAELIRCWIALFEGSVSMRILVRDHREEQRRKSEEKSLKRPQLSPAEERKEPSWLVGAKGSGRLCVSQRLVAPWHRSRALLDYALPETISSSAVGDLRATYRFSEKEHAEVARGSDPESRPTLGAPHCSQESECSGCHRFAA